MTGIAITLTALAMLSGCATAGKLPWTAENVKTVGKKCNLDGITVESHDLIVGGLSELGKEPPAARKIACLRRNIRVPPDFIILYG